MKNIVLIGMINFFPNIINRIRLQNPGALITPNFEEVNAMVKDREEIKLCVITGGYNYSKSPTNNILGYEVVNELHKINSSIPILVINGSKSDISDETGLLEKVSPDEKNVTYIDSREDGYFGTPIEDFVKEFFTQEIKV